MLYTSAYLTLPVLFKEKGQKKSIVPNLKIVNVTETGIDGIGVDTALENFICLNFYIIVH